MKHFARAALGAAVALIVAGGVATTSTTTAVGIDDSRGTPGFCKTDAGVTVVVDFQQLGGKVIVRCFPSAKQGTGLDALKGAGFQIEGVQRWGEAFICRIENRPSAVESLPIQGNDDYKERCIDTPPASGYWSYWHAGNNCAWEYSQWGVKNRAFVPGGFEGWSFSLNATADTNPKPRIAAVRPGTEGGPCTAKNEGAPTSDDPSEQQPGLTGPGVGGGSDPSSEAGEGGSDTAGNSANDESLPAPKPRERSEAPDDPADNVAFTGGEKEPDVNQVLKDQAHASDLAPWVATGAMLALAALAWFTARRRRRAREDG